MSIYDGKFYDCGCGKRHEFFWKDGPHLRTESYSPISTYVLRELRGMKFVFNMTHCHYYNVVKIGMFGNFKTILTFRHGDPQSQIRDYEEQFFKRAGVRNPNKKNSAKTKDIKEINTKAKPPEFSSSTKKTVKKKNSKKVTNKKTSKTDDIYKQHWKLEDKYAKALGNFLKIEKEYLQSSKKIYRQSVRDMKSTGFTKKEIREIIITDIKSFEEGFDKTNKASSHILNFLRSLNQRFNDKNTSI